MPKKNHALRRHLQARGLINPYYGLSAAELGARGYTEAAKAVARQPGIGHNSIQITPNVVG